MNYGMENVCDLDKYEMEKVSGGMRLDNFDPGIDVSEDYSHYYLNPTSGPLSSGYVLA